ncbi:MAG: response regulator [bacterium]
MATLGKILIADDEKVFLKAHADLLREEGYECDCAEDGFIAKQWLASHQYDLLIADIKMPGNEELQLVEARTAMTNDLPVILVTGYPSLHTAVKSTRLAVVGYLMKPLEIDDFLKLVRESIIRFQAFRQFDLARKQLQKTHQEMSALGGLKGFTAPQSAHVNVDVFLHYTIKNILASITDLRDLTKSLAHSTPKQHVCQLINCPRHAELATGLEEAIAVLEKTRSSFRSKDLAALRVKLENLLHSDGDRP